MRYIRVPEITHFHNQNFVPFCQHHPIPPYPSLWQQQKFSLVTGVERPKKCELRSLHSTIVNSFLHLKLIQNLEIKMESQINSLEARIEKMQERFNKDLEEIKKSQYIMNNAISEIKNTLEATNSRITEAEDRISEFEDRMVEINESERKKEKRIKRNEDNLRDLQDNIKCHNIQIIGVP